jgi:hypothetical protein
MHGIDRLVPATIKLAGCSVSGQQGLRRNKRYMPRILCCLTAVLAFSLFCRAALADPFNCASAHCGFVSEGPYPNLVVGTVDGVSTDDQTRRLFEDARIQGFLHDLPNSAEEFRKAIQPISILLPSGHSLTMLVSRVEAQAGQVYPGDLVRFAPHRNIHEHAPAGPAEAIAYWNAIGCVELLCSISDKPCPSRYRSGIYRLDGVALDETGAANPSIVVDTQTFWVKDTAAKH